MKQLLIITIVILNTMVSCKTSKELQNKKDIENKFVESEMKEKGFTLGTLMKSDQNSVCEYVIQVNETLKYDPVNLTDEFKLDTQEVWFKFIGLRRANRCPNISPIQITEIIKK